MRRGGPLSTKSAHLFFCGSHVTDEIYITLLDSNLEVGKKRASFALGNVVTLVLCA